MIDINLKGEKTGIDVAKILRTKWEIPFIFITGQGDLPTFEEAKKEYPAQYILKPFIPKAVLMAIDLTFTNMEKDVAEVNTEQTLTFISPKDKSKKIAVKISEIIWVESRKRYLTYVTKKGHFTEINPIKYAVDTLGLQQIHRSFAVNPTYISEINTYEIILKSGDILPLSRTYKGNLSNI